MQEQMAADLLDYRALILDGVKARKKRSDIYREVDRLIEKQGYENRHQRYPNRVLGHRVTWTPENERSRAHFHGLRNTHSARGGGQQLAHALQRGVRLTGVE